MFWDGLEIDKKRRKEGKKQTQKDKNKQNKKKKKKKFLFSIYKWSIGLSKGQVCLFGSDA